MKHAFKIILFLIGWQLLMLPVLVQAQALLNPNTTQNIGDQAGDVAGQAYNLSTNAATMTWIVAKVIQVFLGLLGIIFVIIVIIAGYNWMTAGGNNEKVEKAKHLLSRATIGLIIIAAAYAITFFVFARLPDAGQQGVGYPGDKDDGFGTGG